MVEFLRERLKNRTVYIIDKPFSIGDDSFYGITKSPVTLSITKKPYTESTLFLEALCGKGIKTIDLGRKRFLLKLSRWLEESGGFWED